MTIPKQTERVSARVPAQVYQTLTQAAEISGATLNQFLVQSALEKAKIIIEKDRIIDLTVRSANVFFEAIENPPAPNKKLTEAMKAYKETFHNDKN
jgi:uncharacterized protein (DUF1778 family)